MAFSDKHIVRVYVLFSLAVIAFAGPFTSTVESGLSKQSGKPVSVLLQKPFQVKQSADVSHAAASHHQRTVEARIADVLSRYRTGLKKHMRKQIPRAIYKMGEKYGYDPMFLTAVIITESSFNNWARSNRDAFGLMQIRPRTGKALADETKTPWKGHKTLFQPKTNIALGTHYLDKLFKRFGDIVIALEAYNHGPTLMARYLRRGYQPEKYSGKVFSHYKKIRLPQSKPRIVFASRTPKAAPATVAASPAAPQAKAQKTVKILKGESLFRLAERLGYDKKDAVRFAAALWMNNVNAFVEGNMNGIQAGQVLNLNDLDEKIDSLDFAQAKKLVDQQWQEWKSYQSLSAPDIQQA